MIGKKAEQMPRIGPLRLPMQYVLVAGLGFGQSVCLLVLDAQVQLPLTDCRQLRTQVRVFGPTLEGGRTSLTSDVVSPVDGRSSA